MRLAGDLPDFESVWVDALAQARVLTPYQAAEINAGRGNALLHGPYLVMRPIGGPQFAECYAARHLDTRRQVRLYVIRQPQRDLAETIAALGELTAKSEPLRSTGAAVVDDFGSVGQTVWATCETVEGTSAADWLVENGRFPAHAVWQIARQLVATLAELETQQIVHGDLCVGSLLLQDTGQVILPAPGLRGIVRPQEGYSFHELRPEAYDCLSPERIADGSPPTVASDIYAGGCLWWHLLTGRPPFAGGNSLAKLRAVHTGRRLDLGQFAAELPAVLSETIAACVAREPEQRPRSFAELAERLGPPSRAGASLVASVVRRPVSPWPTVRRHPRRGKAARAARAVGRCSGDRCRANVRGTAACVAPLTQRAGGRRQPAAPNQF